MNKKILLLLATMGLNTLYGTDPAQPSPRFGKVHQQEQPYPQLPPKTLEHFNIKSPDAESKLSGIENAVKNFSFKLRQRIGQISLGYFGDDVIWQSNQEKLDQAVLSATTIEEEIVQILLRRHDPFRNSGFPRELTAAEIAQLMSLLKQLDKLQKSVHPRNNTFLTAAVTKEGRQAVFNFITQLTNFFTPLIKPLLQAPSPLPIEHIQDSSNSPVDEDNSQQPKSETDEYVVEVEYPLPGRVEEAWAVLGLKSHPSVQEITRHFRTKALVLHPDRGGNTAAYQQLLSAYERAKEFEEQQSQFFEGKK
jgi:hypothetical protein